MLIELLSMSNYGSYNFKIAQIFGLNHAVYLSELLNINSKAIAKNKLEDKYFKLDRKYIESRTTLTTEQQLMIDEDFIRVGILQKNDSNKNMLNLNISVLTSLLTSDDDQICKNIKTIIKTNTAQKKSKTTQKDKNIAELKSFINPTHKELQDALEGWIEGVLARPGGFLSRRAITLFQGRIDQYADHNLDLALKLIDIATINGYRDAEWAINKYEANYKPTYKINADRPAAKAEVNVSEEIF